MKKNDVILGVCSTKNHLDLLANLSNSFPNLYILDLSQCNDPKNIYAFPVLNKISKERYRLIESYSNKAIWGNGRQRYFSTITQLFKYYLPLFKEVIALKQPAYLLLQNDCGFLEKALIYLCKKANITTIFLQDGLFITAIRDTSIAKWNEKISTRIKWKLRQFVISAFEMLGYPFLASSTYGTGYSDYYIFWSEFERQRLNRFAHKSKNSKSIICISPRLKESLQNVNSGYKKETSTTTIAFFTTNFDTIESLYNQQKQVKELVNEVENYPNFKLIIKPHPAEDESFYMQFCNRKNVEVVFKEKKVWSQQIIVNVNLCITNISGIYYEALLLKTPVVIYKTFFEKDFSRIYFPNYDFLPSINQKDEIKSFFKKINPVFLHSIAEMQSIITNNPKYFPSLAQCFEDELLKIN